MKKFKVGIDVDDLIYECVSYALNLANKDETFTPPLSLEEVNKWGKLGTRTDIIFKYFDDISFYENQPLIEGAVDFVKEVSKRAEVFFITAAYPEAMSVRAKRLIVDFPFIPKENIIIGTRKDMVDVDILFDDGAHNIQASKSAYPILMRRPWNRHITGCLAVNNYGEALSLLDMILSSYVYTKEKEYQGNKLIALVGPSASGKTEISNHLVETGKAIRGVSYTTRKKRDGEVNGKDYYFIDKKTFFSLRDNGFFFETTSYAEQYYGSAYETVEQGLTKNNVVMPLDITGAVACKKAFGNKVILAFVERDQEAIISAILNRNIPNEEKVKRIMSYPDEYKNREICDCIIENNGTIEDAVKQLERSIKNEL